MKYKKRISTSPAIQPRRIITDVFPNRLVVISLVIVLCAINSLPAAVSAETVVELNPLLDRVARGAPNRVARGVAPDRREYGVVIDAGSSGSRVWVYRWPASKKRWVLPKIEPVYTERVQPGLADYAEDINNMSNVIKKLINVAKAYVPVQLQPATSIYLLATAGESLFILQLQL